MMIDSASRSGSALGPTVETLSWRRGSLSASSTSGRHPARQGVRAAMAAIPGCHLGFTACRPRGGVCEAWAATSRCSHGSSAAGVVGQDCAFVDRVLRSRGAVQPTC